MKLSELDVAYQAERHRDFERHAEQYRRSRRNQEDKAQVAKVQRSTIVHKVLTPVTNVLQSTLR